MKLSDIVMARPALQKLIMQDMPIKLAFETAKIITACNPHLEFYGAEMQKTAMLPDELRETKQAELLELDVEELGSFKPLQIPLSLPLQLSAADIKRLEPLACFVAEGVDQT